jgi:DNA-binding XRE family transcriptional regulator
MSDYSRPLGDTVKQARTRLKLTQSEVAELIDVDPRTVLNIENYKGNPKMEVLYPLIRVLNIDAREIFSPEMLRDSPSIQRLRQIIDSCTEEEALLLIPVVSELVTVLRRKDAIAIE